MTIKRVITGLFIGLMGIGITANAHQLTIGNDTLNLKQQSIVSIAALTATGDLENLKPALNTGLDTGLTIHEIQEVIIHLYAYAGFPRSIHGLQTLMTVLDERRAEGIDDKWGSKASPITDSNSRYDRGKEILEKLTGDSLDGPKKGYAAFAPQIEIFLKEHLFADLFERDVLSWQERELVTVSVLAGIGGVDPFLQSHMNIALYQKTSPAQLKHLIDLIRTNIGQKQANAANQVLNKLLKSKNIKS